MSPPVRPLDTDGRRIVICDYNALLLSVTGLLRMSGFVVFQAYDARAALELCAELPNIELLILNTTGTGTDSPSLVREIREKHPNLPALHIGPTPVQGCRRTCRRSTSRSPPSSSWRRSGSYCLRECPCSVPRGDDGLGAMLGKARAGRLPGPLTIRLPH